MSQPYPYKHQIEFPDVDRLRTVVRSLLAEEEHAHNFEVWMDELAINVNDMGLSCVLRHSDLTLAGMKVEDVEEES